MTVPAAQQPPAGLGDDPHAVDGCDNTMRLHVSGNRFTSFSAGRDGKGRLGRLAAAACAITALAVLAVLTASPRSSPAPPEGSARSTAAVTSPAGSAAPDPDVDLSDAEQVCAGFAAALFTVTGGDMWPRDAYRRAAAYTTAELAAALATEEGRLPISDRRPVPGGVKVTAYVGDHIRPDTHGVAYRAVLVLVVDRAGTRSAHVVYCTLHETGHGWLVTAYEQERSLP